jgi:hypothetical protein
MELGNLLGELLNVGFTKWGSAHVNMLDDFNMINGLHFGYVFCNDSQGLFF